MKRPGTQLEFLLYAAALALALALRLAALGRLPLSDAEAGLALQALALSRGQPVLLDPHPAYLSLTTLCMFLFGPLNGMARLWPALAGSLLVLSPALFKHTLGRLPALLLAFALALDPLLLSVSRQAGSLTLALAGLFFAVGFWQRRRPILAGLSAGLALMSGPALWLGLLGLVIAALLAPRFMINPPAHATAPLPETPRSARPALLAALAAVFFLGTLFLTIPGGLGAVTGGLAAFFAGWGQGGGVPPVAMLLGLLSYGFFPLLLGLWGAITGLLRRRSVDVFLSIWWLVSLALALAYPARQVTDLVWTLLPLWALAARQGIALLIVPRYDRLPVLGQAMLALVILAFAALTLVSLANLPQVTPLEKQQYALRLVGAALMLVAGAGLIGWGWSRQVAVRGLAWGLGMLLLAFLVAAAWNASGLSTRQGREVWPSSAQPVGMDLLQRTITDLQTRNEQRTGALDIVVVDQPSPALRWMLRDQRRVSYVSQVPTGDSPALVITAERPDLGLAAAYRGEAFTVAESSRFSNPSPAAWLRWLVFRKLPDEQVQRQRVILWARGDLFPGGAAQP
jgi:hypothetical protein